MTSPLQVWVNGRRDGSVPASDRGLQYGDGVFRTLYVHGGRAVQLQRQLQLLARDCARLGLPLRDFAGLEARISHLCRDTTRGVAKVILTRGSGARGYRPEPAASPTEILLLYDYPATHTAERWQAGVALHLCTTRLGMNPALAGIKHLNRLEQVLARAEWDAGEAAEGLMLDTAGNVIAGTMSNLFIVRENRLLTPDLAQAGVSGLMRGMILEAAADWKGGCAVTTLRLEDCLMAEEIFVCNSLVGIWPVRALCDRRWQPGTLTRRLQRHFADPYHPGAAGTEA